MEEKKKVTDAEVVKETPKETTKESTVSSETSSDAANTTAHWPWVPFVAGILVAILGWQLYSVITNDRMHTEDVVATVGDLIITQDELNQSLEQAEALATQQGLDITNDEARVVLEEQALDALINTKILVAAAAEADFSVTDEEIDAQIETVAAQFGSVEGLLAQAQTLGLDEDALREDIGEQLTVDAYLRSVVDIEAITATPEEVQEVYDELTAAGQELPPLAEIQAGIEAQIVSQKQQEAIVEHIDSLRTETTVEIK